MDCSWIGDQYHAESDRTNKEISNSRTSVGTGGKDEKIKGQTLEINMGHEIRNSKQIRMIEVRNLK
jgi:hypothetical protein